MGGAWRNEIIHIECCLDIHVTWHTVTYDKVMIFALIWLQKGLQSWNTQVSLRVKFPEQSQNKNFHVFPQFSWRSATPGGLSVEATEARKEADRDELHQRAFKTSGRLTADTD